MRHPLSRNILNCNQMLIRRWSPVHKKVSAYCLHQKLMLASYCLSHGSAKFQLTSHVFCLFLSFYSLPLYLSLFLNHSIPITSPFLTPHILYIVPFYKIEYFIDVVRVYCGLNFAAQFELARVPFRTLGL